MIKKKVIQKEKKLQHECINNIEHLDTLYKMAEIARDHPKEIIEKAIYSSIPIENIHKIIQHERPDYIYLRDLFRKVRDEFNVEVTTRAKHLTYVPSEETLRHYYNIVWQTRDIKYMLLVKTLVYTGVRVSELIGIKLADIDFDACPIHINQGKGSKVGKKRLQPVIFVKLLQVMLKKLVWKNLYLPIN